MCGAYDELVHVHVITTTERYLWLILAGLYTLVAMVMLHKELTEGLLSTMKRRLLWCVTNNPVRVIRCDVFFCIASGTKIRRSIVRHPCVCLRRCSLTVLVEAGTITSIS